MMPDERTRDADKRRRIAVVTVGRSDFSILKPLVERIAACEEFDVGFWVGGAHYDPGAGKTIDDVRASGLPIWAEVKSPGYGTGPEGTVRSMAEQLEGYGLIAAQDPGADLAIILGDRFEAISAGLALVPFGLPIAHISGGSVTEGAIDDVFRHCLTKMAALHFCDIPEFARRIHQMGEPTERIFTVGALGLDGISSHRPNTYADFARHFDLGVEFGPGYAIATLHPETRAPGSNRLMAEAMVASLVETGRPTIYTYPNADPGSEEIVEVIEAAAKSNDNHHVVRNFGSKWFYTAMEHAGFMIGNSSSGIIEAASFGLPVVDIGDRQKGRFHGKNVLHCDRTRSGILEAVRRVTTDTVRKDCKHMINPYGDGRAAERIVETILKLRWDWLCEPKPFAHLESSFTGTAVEF